ncbi:MAG: FecR domain-containing protein, partial [Acidobacteriia bacterium]|nr:FecR domain-containing protein [Terriglobia bacterium]
MKSSGWVLGMALAVVVAGMEPVRAQDPEDLKRGVARISFLNGEISIQRGDSGEWVAGAVNAPVVANDRISTALNSRAEIEFDSGYGVRIGGGADVTVMALEASRSQLAIGYGMLTVRVLRQTNADIEVDTPNVSVRPSKVGTYRIAVSDSGESQIIARSGDVEVFTPRGSQWVYAGQMMIARGTAADPEFQIVQAGAPDEWDRWNDSRDRPILNSPSQRNVPAGVYGSEDLDPYGNWVNVPPYGNVWQPMEPAGWAPYQAGRWVWLDWYGWTWIGYEPWGWAPYHYGRWFYSAPYGWLWYPGAIGVRHYWSPALVAFFGFGGAGVGFANVGWVPLAPYE